MRTTSLLKVGPPAACAGGGCSTARCRAATNAKTKADAMTIRRMWGDATSYARNDSLKSKAINHRGHGDHKEPLCSLCLCGDSLPRFDRSGVERDLTVDDRQHAPRSGKRVDRNLEDVLRQDRQVGEL